MQLINQRYAGYAAAAKAEHKLALRWMMVRRGIITATILTIACAPSFWQNRTAVAWYCDQSFQDPENAILLDTINPNDAPWFSLVSLPTIGPARAHAIVAYRQQISSDNQQRRAFSCPQDLDNVPSIGPATIGACRTYLSCTP